MKTRALPAGVSDIINGEDDLFFSAVSIWEVAIKFARQRPDFTVDPRPFRDGLIRRGYYEIPIDSVHAVSVLNLPPIHRDPFDRLLIAQAVVEGHTLLTTDQTIAKYPGPILHV